MVHVQEMDAADVEAVSTIRVRGWQAAYAGIVPQTYLDAMTVEVMPVNGGSGFPNPDDSHEILWHSVTVTRWGGSASGRGEVKCLIWDGSVRFTPCTSHRI
ncbi:hypothetical protein ACIQM4_27640 [Streptomyces sp. NPDC091272]|uniref:hypothetical protein n=1 Tax=Streptomyces sp. NPDC091272 TaxID=3365981 RepID=UPI00380ED21A